MTRKEEVLQATLELAAEQGLKSVTLSQIARRVGIKTPSLYNHFASKEAIFQAAYAYLREQAKERSGAVDAGHPSFSETQGLEEVLTSSFEGYATFVLDPHMLQFLRVLYAERSTSPLAAQIMVDETERMVRSVKALFYALVAHGRLQVDDVDTAALSYAMTVHALVDYRMDLQTAQGAEAPQASGAEAFPEVLSFISWFTRQMEPDHA